jgi:hypothetical protein
LGWRLLGSSYFESEFVTGGSIKVEICFEVGSRQNWLKIVSGKEKYHFIDEFIG